MQNHIYKKNIFDLLYKEQNDYLKNRLKKIKSSIYLNNFKSLSLSKDKKKINNKLNDNKSKNL